MRITIKFLLMIIIGFTIVSGTLETYRLVNTTLQVKENIRTIALDAIELALMDEYYKEGIHILDEEALVTNFKEMLISQYALDMRYKPLRENQVYGEFVVDLEYDLGSYLIIYHDNSYRQGVKPYLRVSGNTSIQPMILNFNQRLDINYDITVSTESLFKHSE